MATVETFEPGYNGELYLSWQKPNGGYCGQKFNVRMLSRKQFKRVIRLLLNSGQWYRDSSQDGYGEWNDYGTTYQCVDDNEPLTAIQVVRWMWSIYR